MNVEDNSKWTKAILKLTRLTRDGQISWIRTALAPQGLLSTGLDAYETHHEGQRLHLRRQERVGIQSFGPASEFLLAILDPAGTVMWTFPTVAALADLYQAIRYHEAGIASYIDRLASDP